MKNDSIITTILKMKNYLIILSVIVILTILIVVLVTTLSKNNYESFLLMTTDYIVLTKIPRDYLIFTQGLLLDQLGYVIESGGLYGESKLIKYKLESPGTVVAQYSLNSNIFAEGATIINETIYQLTWREKKIYLYQNYLTNFSLINVYDMPSEINEGWGITNNNNTLYFSDGSSSIYSVDPYKMKVKTKITVLDKIGNKYERINELEYVKGLIYANIWYSNIIIVINCENGLVERKIDFSDLFEYEQNYSKENLTSLGHVLNGIAYDTKTDNFIITGKKWKHIYVVKLIEK
jgi:glutamine cyclotransferase